ncbi:extracellular solute-binding protein [Sinorhizobium meliloti]|uniref:Extracellular solute-binding protein n=2 Tax=Rhizobium meliloti TaxID=382 RepID=A0AAW9TJC0_RHIML|nr:extracellular solute-binding protein [Sinorhizobium meliloti]
MSGATSKRNLFMRTETDFTSPILSRRQVLIGGIASTFIVAGAQFGQAADSIELSILHTDPALVKELHEDIAANFVALFPNVRIRFTIVPTYDEALAQSLRDALTDNPPDIAFHGLNNISLLAERGLLTSLDRFIDKEPSWGQLGYHENLKQFCRHRSQTWGLPFALSTLICYYNQELVERVHGTNVNFPSNWDDIAHLASEIRAPSGGVHFHYQSTGNVFLFDLICSFGGQILDADHRTVLFDSPAGLKALEVLKSLGEARGGPDIGTSAARAAYAAGTLGILVDSSSALTNFLKQAEGKFTVGTARIPLPGGTDVRLPSAGSAATIMSQDVQRQELSWNYIKFATNPENQTALAKQTGYIPVNNIAISEPALLGDYYRRRPLYGPAVSMLPNLTGWRAFPGENALKIDKAIQDLARDVLTLKKEPQAALEEMAEVTRRMIGDG